MYRRTDFFSCGDKYVVRGNSTRNLRIEKCPICEKEGKAILGTYEFSMTEERGTNGQPISAPTPTPAGPVGQARTRTIDIESSFLGPNPDGTFGTPIIQPDFTIFTPSRPSRQDANYWNAVWGNAGQPPPTPIPENADLPDSPEPISIPSDWMHVEPSPPIHDSRSPEERALDQDDRVEEQVIGEADEEENWS